VNSSAAYLLVVHLVGLALGVGAGTAKLVLLLKCRNDPSFVDVYLRVVRPLTRLIILGLILLTLSGIGWLLLGYSSTPLLIVKLFLVAAIWILGPVIDNSIEPKIRGLPQSRAKRLLRNSSALRISIFCWKALPIFCSIVS